MKRQQEAKYGAMSFEEIGHVLGVSADMVRIIEREALDKIRAVLLDPRKWPCRQLRVPALLKQRLLAVDVMTPEFVELESRLVVEECES